MRWDPEQYCRFAGPRSRPFFDLVDQIHATDPHLVVDLGCGSGALTATLAERWPGAAIRGVEPSTEMIGAAPADSPVQFVVGSAESFDAHGVDVLISNAALQWVPNHPQLIEAWAHRLPVDGWLAFQVPANFDAPSHALMRQVAADPRWSDVLTPHLRDATTSLPPAQYLELLATAGLTVDAWQTDYLHVLAGDDPVLEWVRGTGLRPLLAALSPAQATAFEAEYAALLREAYPAREFGTLFGFLRTFVVAHKSHT